MKSIALIAGCAATLAVVSIGVCLMSPKKTAGGLLLIWGVFAATRGDRTSAPSYRRTLFLVGIAMIVAGGATFLFTSDWGAGGDCPTVIYCDVRDAKTSAPVSGAVVVLAADNQELLKGTTDDDGVWVGRILVPYLWHYRIIGSGGVLNLDGLSVTIHADGARSTVNMNDIRNVQIFGRTETQTAPAFVVVPLTIDRRGGTLRH